VRARQHDDDQPGAAYKNLVRVHFQMDDNPSNTPRILERYKTMHTGVFYRRYVLGLWCAADGLIYDSFDEPVHTYSEPPQLINPRRYIAIDYGTSNPMCFLEILDDGNIARIQSEYYYSSKERGRQKTDTEYAEDFVKFAGTPEDVLYVVLDPSAASFKIELRNRGYRVKDADNDVRNGISKVSTMFALKKLLINRKCRSLINELLGYIWDEKAAERGDERPIKSNDHACDALRYGIATVIYSKRRFRVE
jgi:PBSX family phage terminase large subunit